MKLHRFYIEEGSFTPRNFHIQNIDIVSHIRLVLRLKKGDEIILFDGQGMEYRGKIGYLDKKQVAGLIESSWEAELPNKPRLILAQALPRAGKIDEIIRMNTEAGVAGFILFEGEYSVPKKDDYTDTKMKRIRKIAQEALRQSEGVLMPEFKGPLSFDELLKAEADHKLVLHSRDVKDSVNVKELKAYTDQIVVAIIGPEGGLSERELEMAIKAGFKPVHLDMPVLRTETAGIVLSAILLS